MHYAFTIFALMLCQSLLAFQTNTGRIQEQYAQAALLNEQRAFKQAAELAKRILSTLNSEDNNLTDAALIEIGSIHILGDCALDESNFSEAFHYYQQAALRLEETLPEKHPLRVIHYNKIGNYHREIKDFETALEHFYKGLQLGSNIFKENNLVLAKLYNNIGICLDAIGDHEKALDHYQQALAIRTELLPNPHPQIAQSYNNIGLCLLEKGERQGAVPSFQQALEIYRRFYKKDHQDIADVHLNLGNAYFEGLQEACFDEYFQALDIYRKILDNKHPSIAICYNNLANAYDGKNDFFRASKLYQQALEITIHNYGEIHPDVAMAYHNIGVSRFFAGDVQAAMEAFQQALHALNYRTDVKTALDEVNDHQTLLKVFKSIADIKIRAHNETKDQKLLEQALGCYHDIDRLLDYLRNRYDTDGSKRHLMQAAHDIYDIAIEVALALYRRSKDEQFLHFAFQFSEKSKGMLLLEAVKKTKAELFSGIPPEVLTSIRDAESAISELEKNRYLSWQKPGVLKSARLDSLNQLLFTRKQRLAEKIQEVEKTYPAYFNMRYATKPLPVRDIQQQLIVEGRSLLSYFRGSNSLHIFVINKNDFNVVSVDLDAEFFHWLNAFNYAIRSFPHYSSSERSENIQTYLQAAHQLYQYLIWPVKDQLEERLIVIPDGELGYLSFGALLSEAPIDQHAFRTHPYLIRQHSISYSYSVQLLKEMMERKSIKGLHLYLGIAPEFRQGNDGELQPLKFNMEEVQTAFNLLGGKQLLGEKASKKGFVHEQDKFRIIHLATHGKANSTAGDYSFLAFSETTENKGNDALLYVKDIYNMSTQAELIVLSACETGIGEFQKGEGVASIARSFSYAGAQSLLATQWSVDDKATHDLVGLFFEKLKKGQTKDQALQAAMLEFLQTQGAGKAHPYFWASFVPVGKMESILVKRSFPLAIWGAPLVVIALLAFFKRRSKIKT